MRLEESAARTEGAVYVDCRLRAGGLLVIAWTTLLGGGGTDRSRFDGTRDGRGWRVGGESGPASRKVR